MISTSPKPFVIGITLAMVGVLAIAYVRQKNVAERILAENEQLRRQIGEQAETKAAREAIAAMHTTAKVDPEVWTDDGAGSGMAPAVSAAPAQTPNGQDLILTPTGMAAEPRTDGLELVDSSAVETASGIRTTLRFMPTISDPVGIVAVVVRLPKDDSGSITDIQLTGDMKYADVAKRIAEDGKFAVVQIHAETVENLQVQLDLSGPAVADMRGTAGIGPYDLQVGYGTVNVMKK